MLLVVSVFGVFWRATLRQKHPKTTAASSFTLWFMDDEMHKFDF